MRDELYTGLEEFNQPEMKMKKEILLYKDGLFNGTLYAKYCGEPVSELVLWLYRNGELIEKKESSNYLDIVQFEKLEVGLYHIKCECVFNGGASAEIISKKINVMKKKSQSLQSTGGGGQVNLKGGGKFYDNIENYYLEIKILYGDLDSLNLQCRNIYSRLTRKNISFSFKHVYSQRVLEKKGMENLTELYRIVANIERSELLNFSSELEKLDYVIYCSVTPDTTFMQPPKAPQKTITERVCPNNEPNLIRKTPSFIPLQKYLEKKRGMNVHAAWDKGATGYGATVRHLDFGVYKNHENLSKITVINSRPESEDCDHGTASTGCIAATSGNFGVSGIAHNCQFYFYDTGDIDKIVRDSQPGDIVGLDIQFQAGDDLIPVIDNKSWWDKIKTLSDRGVTVILAAGNGGLDLSKRGVINDYGDCGGILAGACYHNTGRRCDFSNYGHSTSLVNSWGDWSVCTTGYGDLQNMAGNNRDYTDSYAGTSSATPLSVGAAAVMQGYAIRTYGTYYNNLDFRKIFSNTGYTEGVVDKIGTRPNLESALEYIDKLEGDDNRPPLINGQILVPVEAISGEHLVAMVVVDGHESSGFNYRWDVGMFGGSSETNASIISIISPAVEKTVSLQISVRVSIGSESSIISEWVSVSPIIKRT
jgi:subtilisin family serine protease